MYQYFTDPGHGWLKVKKSELIALKIAEKISSCSYEKNGFVYLEEDCDMHLFVETKFPVRKDAIHFMQNSVKYNHTDHQSTIRNYNLYS